MSQEKKRQASRKAPRTQIEDLAPAVEELSEEKAPRTRIEDLPPPIEELSEEEASLAAGGIIGLDMGCGNCGGVASGPTRVANTCTRSTFLGLPASDSDYGND